MRAFKAFVGYVEIYTQPTKGTKSTMDCRQVNAEKLTKPAWNRQNLKKADKITPKNPEITDNELYISGSAFSGAWGAGKGTAEYRAGVASYWLAPGLEGKTGEMGRLFEQNMVFSGLLGDCQESVT